MGLLVGIRLRAVVDLEIGAQRSADMIVGKAPVLQKSGLPRPFLPIGWQFRAEFAHPGLTRQLGEIGRWLAIAPSEGLVDGFLRDALALQLLANTRRPQGTSRTRGHDIGAVARVVELAGLLEIDEHGLDGVFEIPTLLE